MLLPVTMWSSLVPAASSSDPGTLGGSSLASWNALVAMLVAFAVIVAGLALAGRPDPAWGPLRHLARVPRGLTRVTGIPGWAAVAVGMALFGLLVAGEGFYSDVAWHIAMGRDDDLLTAPHMSILLGLVWVLGGAVLGTVVATLDRVEGWRVGALRIPPALLPLWALGVAAVSGFPLDEVWHQAYGIDVTMWSPTHMLMILGASFTGLAAWVVLAGAGVRPTDGRWARGVHLVCAWLTLQGLVAGQGEFSFGVPQFSQLFHPILVCLAGGLALVATRLVHGRWWTVGVAAASFLLMSGVMGDEGAMPVETRQGGTFVVSAVLVEVLGRALGTERRLRFAVASGLAVGTVGLAAEWWWNQGAPQPWTSALLPDAVVLGVIAAVGAAVLGAVVGGAVARDGSAPLPTVAVVVAGLACVAVVVLPLRRSVGDVQADMTVEPTSEPGWADVEVVLTPADAADDAYWFQATAWQGGGLVLADMEPTGEPGIYRTAEPVPVDGLWKTLLRLHRGGEMMAVPVWFPADAEIDEPEIPAEDRTIDFASERRYLMREASDQADGVLSPVIHGVLAAAVALWAAAFAVAVRDLQRAARPPPRRDPSVRLTGWDTDTDMGTTTTRPVARSRPTRCAGG
jgi:hypothetical protein